MKFGLRKLFLIIIIISVFITIGFGENLKIFEGSEAFNNAMKGKQKRTILNLKNGVYSNGSLVTALYNISGNKYQLQIDVNPKYNKSRIKTFQKAKRSANFYIKVMDLYLKYNSVNSLNTRLSKYESNGDKIFGWGEMDRFVRKLRKKFGIDSDVRGDKLLKLLNKKMKQNTKK